MKGLLAVLGAIILVLFLLALELVMWGVITFLAMKGIDLISVHTGHGTVFPKDLFNVIWGSATFLLFVLKRLI